MRFVYILLITICCALGARDPVVGFINNTGISSDEFDVEWYSAQSRHRQESQGLPDRIMVDASQFIVSLGGCGRFDEVDICQLTPTLRACRRDGHVYIACVSKPVRVVDGKLYRVSIDPDMGIIIS